MPRRVDESMEVHAGRRARGKVVHVSPIFLSRAFIVVVSWVAFMPLPTATATDATMGRWCAVLTASSLLVKSCFFTPCSINSGILRTIAGRLQIYHCLS